MPEKKKPVLFRAIHTKTRWRKACHENFDNARSVGKRSALALFRGENDAIDLTKHGQPLYVVIWAEGAAVGEILRPSPHGYQTEPVALNDILRWEEAGGANGEEFDRYFRQVDLVGRIPTPDAPVLEVAAGLAMPENETDLNSTDGREAQASSADEVFAEGRIFIQAHIRRERDSRVRDRLLADRRNRGALACQMCDRQAAKTDAMLSEAIFEAHHLVPLAEGARETSLDDVALLCACCHRLIHRAMEIHERWLSIEQARPLFTESTAQNLGKN